MNRHSGTIRRRGCIVQAQHAPMHPRAFTITTAHGDLAHPSHAMRPPYQEAALSPRTAQRSLVHLASLALVWLTIATSGLVFSEPAPTDALAIGLIVLLPVVGLVAISPMLVGYLALWLITAASGFLAATMAADIADPAKFTAVSTFLYISSFVFAAFVARNAVAHTQLIFKAWTVAALAATVAGFIGYFELLPGAFDLFTRFGRATGTFKDPNVFGPFLVAPFLYALHVAIERPWRSVALPLAVTGFLALGVFLSFSRGAWLNLALALVVFGWLAFVTTSSEAQRKRIIHLIAAGALLIAIVVLGALQNERIVSLLGERASVTQSYDVGPEGRFGGQEKAIGLILENPLGIGATVFASVHHHEEVHNVYLSMMLNAGWLGGALFLLMIVLTLALGLRHAFTRSQTASKVRPLFLIAYAAFLANALEGVIIDIDHWRHVYLLMALVWGMMSAGSQRPLAQDVRQAGHG